MSNSGLGPAGGGGEGPESVPLAEGAGPEPGGPDPGSV